MIRDPHRANGPPPAAPWLLLIALAVLLSAGAQAGAAAPTLQREGGRLSVQTARYRAVVDPDRGGRIVSLVFDGAELTGVGPDGRGGLLEELHTAHLPYELADYEATEAGLRLTLRAESPEMAVTRELFFPRDGPFIAARFTFENRRAYALSGAAAPALRNVALPAGGRATGQEIYCLNRGAGPEALPARLYASELHADPGAARLRWLAVADPIGRRALAFTLSEGGSRTLPPARTAEGALTLGWRLPAVPAGRHLEHEFVVAPLRGFASLAEVNRQFAADSLVRPSGRGAEVRFTLMPLERSLSEVSVITRTYDAEGREGEPCEPMLFEDVPVGAWPRAHTRVPDTAACLVHEVYSEGDRLGAFALRADGGAGCDLAPRGELPPPRLEAARGQTHPWDAEAGPPTDAERERGFTLRDPAVEGSPPHARAVELTLTAGEARTRFLAVGALRDIKELRFSVTGPPAGSGMARGMPPGAARSWRVSEQGGGPARLEPFTPFALQAGETRWLAWTADAAAMEPGRFQGRLTVSADGHSRDIPLALEVVPRPAPAPESFGLWHLGAPGGTGPRGHALSKLRAYGVSGLALTDGPAVAAFEAPDGDFRLLAHGAARGALPPAGPPPGADRSDGTPPLWLLVAEAAPPDTAETARRLGYAPLPLLPTLPPPEEAGALPGKVPHILVREGCPPGRVPALLEAGALEGAGHVWVHLDLCGVDWRQALTLVRSACWAAAWQGLAGVAVCVEPPLAEVDRELVIWHVLRDARAEVALWREVRRDARLLRARADEESGLETAISLALERLERAVGTAAQRTLPLRRVRTASGEVLRAVPPVEERDLDTSPYETARDAVLEAARAVGEPARGRRGPDGYATTQTAR